MWHGVSALLSEQRCCLCLNDDSKNKAVTVAAGFASFLVSRVLGFVCRISLNQFNGIKIFLRGQVTYPRSPSYEVMPVDLSPEMLAPRSGILSVVSLLSHQALEHDSSCLLLLCVVAS